MRKIGIVGVGLLGTAIAQRLLDGGFAVTGYDTRPAQLEPLRARGLVPTTTVAEVARDRDAVLTVLPTLDAVDRVVTELLEVAEPHAVVVQMSTISPTLTRSLAAAAAAKGLGFLDAPVSGTSAMVARGDCTIFVGGERARLDACRPLFDAIARRSAHLGEAGAASLAKLATNLLVGLNTAALAEALVLGVKGGLDPAALLDVLRDSAGSSRMVEIRGPLMVSHRFEPQMKLELFLKDFALMLDEGRRLGVPLPLTSLTKQLCTATAADGRGGEDIAVLITTLEKLSGIGA
jgi:3-hydroxyisobutyrate dehydrogenase-like beta-hydroxyacid dehydrogenase